MSDVCPYGELNVPIPVLQKLVDAVFRDISNLGYSSYFFRVNLSCFHSGVHSIEQCAVYLMHVLNPM